MRIIKLDIFNSKSNIRPGDFIKKLYPNIMTRLSGFKFAFHPRAKKFSMGISDLEILQKSIVVKSRNLRNIADTCIRMIKLALCVKNSFRC